MKPPTEKYTDETIMPWGKHKGEALKDMPADYFMWLSDQTWVSDWPQLHIYIQENKDAFAAEKKDDDKDDETKGYNSYQDFLDDR